MKQIVTAVLTAGTASLFAFTAQDTARLPISINVDATVMATPISMIEGAVPSSPFSLNMIASKTDTLRLPVDTKDVTPIESRTSIVSSALSVVQNDNQLSLKIPTSMAGATLILRAVDGSVIGKQQLDQLATYSLSLWETAAGVYILSVAKGDQVMSAKVHLPSGGCRIQTEFGGVTTLAESRRERATAASYQLKITSKNNEYNDSTFTLSLDRGVNTATSIALSKKTTVITPITTLLDSATYEKFFPMRYSKNGVTGVGQKDFYTYRSFVSAVEYLSDYTATVYYKPSSGGDRVVVKKKSTGETHEYVTVGGYHANTNAEIARVVDYAKLFTEGSAETIKQELAAYLANASQETTGGWATAQPSQWAWGLCFVHESPYTEATKDDRFTDEHAVYGTKSSLEWSFHGRGPKQLTYNYNYGMLSDFMFFDKMKLLNDPNIIARDAKLAWVSSLWFWMTPQGQKPSCHEVMVGTWQPTTADQTAGRTTSKFGMTVNIINGGVECGYVNQRAVQRAEHYKYFSGFLKITPESNCGCDKMSPY